MCAKGHIFVGITTAATTAIIASSSTNYDILTINVTLCALSSLITSQLPDIDTPNSRISRAFPIMKILTSRISIAMEICAICVMICALQINQKPIFDSGYKYLIALIIIFILQIWLRQNMNHRGVTHSLLFNILLSIAVLYPYFTNYQSEHYFMFALGVISGLGSHLVYDTITIRGCPLFYPFSKKVVRPLKRLKIRSGEDDVIGVAFSFIILLTAVLAKLT